MPKKLSKRPAKKLAKTPPEKLAITPGEFFNPWKPDPFPELRDHTAVYRYVRGKDFTVIPATLHEQLKRWGHKHGFYVKVVIHDDGTTVDASSRPLTDKEVAETKRRSDQARARATAAQIALE